MLLLVYLPSLRYLILSRAGEILDIGRQLSRFLRETASEEEERFGAGSGIGGGCTMLILM